MYYLVYALLYLISLLPFRLLYVLSDTLYVLLYRILGYRKKVVMGNLKIAFPEKSEEERKKIAKKFYHNLIDYFLETLKMISVSEKSFFKRCTSNFEIVNAIAEKGKNIQIHSSHQFNTEYANWVYSKESVVPFIGMYMPFTNKAIDKIILKTRSRFGTRMIDIAKFGRAMRDINQHQYMLGWSADQNPVNPAKAFWLYFFKKPAPFATAPEKTALKNNTAVVFARWRKQKKRGYYHFENVIITENAADLKTGELTKKYRDFLEETIHLDPANYLWSHRRWKHEYKEEYKKLWIDD